MDDKCSRFHLHTILPLKNKDAQLNYCKLVLFDIMPITGKERGKFHASLFYRVDSG